MVYTMVKPKVVVLSRWMIVNSNNEQNQLYIYPGVTTLTASLRVTRGTPLKVTPSVVTASQSDEERTLTGSLAGLVLVLIETQHSGPSLLPPLGQCNLLGQM